MGQTPVHTDSTADGLDRWAPRVFVGLVAVVVVARLWLVFHRLYDPDELQHLHAGYCVWNGMVPYRDFFEQHEPVLWYLSVPLFSLWGESLNVLFAGRVLIWMAGALTFFLVWILGNRMYGRWAGSIAALLLAVHPSYQEKNIEWRPDNLAVPLVLLALICTHRMFDRHGRWWSALIGALLAAGFLCTQKTAYVGSGLVLGIACSLWIEARRSRAIGSAEVSPSGGSGVWRRLVALAVGAASVGALALLWFASQGALTEFVQMTIVAPLEWKTKEPMLRYLVANLTWGSVLWGAAAGGLVLALGDAGRSDARRAGAIAIVGGVAAHSLGLLSVPAAFLQYYLPLTPLAALLAGRALAALAGCTRSGTGLESSRRTLPALASIVGLALTVVALLLRGHDPSLAPASSIVMASLLVLSIVAYFLGFRRLGVLTVLFVAAIGAAAHQQVQFRWSHEQQTQRIEALMRATEPNDRFFDGFTGFGALRPHAFFYYWINDHSWPMIPLAERQAGVLESLADPRTRVVLVDQHLRRYLPIEAKGYLDRNFEMDPRYSDPLPPTSRWDVLVFVRRGRELPAIESVETVGVSAALRTGGASSSPASTAVRDPRRNQIP